MSLLTSEDARSWFIFGKTNDKSIINSDLLPPCAQHESFRGMMNEDARTRRMVNFELSFMDREHISHRWFEEVTQRRTVFATNWRMLRARRKL